MDNGLQKLAVVMAGLLPVVQRNHGAEGLQMMFAVPLPIKTQGHEVCPTVLLQQATRRHVDPGGTRHPVIGELDTSIISVSYTHLRAHETRHDLVCRLLLEKKK